MLLQVTPTILDTFLEITKAVIPLLDATSKLLSIIAFTIGIIIGRKTLKDLKNEKASNKVNNNIEKIDDVEEKRDQE